MIKKRLLGLVPDSKKYILENVIFQWIGMCSNVVMVYTIVYLLDDILKKEQVSTAEVVQLAGEGVEQLETYFGQYMPQKAQNKRRRSVRQM